MIIRLGLSVAIVAGIYIASPVRSGADPARLVGDFAESTAASLSRAPLAAAMASGGLLAIRPTLDGLVEQSLRQDVVVAPPPRHSIERAAIDTLKPGDRRAAWRGLDEG